MATPMMPDAPDAQNRMMAPAAVGPEANGAPMPMSGGPNAMQGPGAPPAPSAPGPQPTPVEIAQARRHVGAIASGLSKLLAVPRGDLTKKAVFDSASDMIAQGAFATPEGKQDLIVRLAQLPDEEPALRRALGALLLSIDAHRASFHQVFGEG